MNNLNFCNNTRIIRTNIISRVFVLFILSLPFQYSFASNNLSSLQQEITKSKTTKSLQEKKRKALEESIANLEQQTAAATLQAEETSKAIKAEKERLNKLKGHSKTLNKDKIRQQKMLEQQLVGAYMTGQNDLIKLMLNQEDINQIVRAKSYYHYLNQARIESIEALKNTEQLIEQNEEDQDSSLAALEKMYQQQKVNKDKLLAQRNERSKALKELKQDINYQSARLSQLKEAQKRLQAKLTQQKEARKKQKLTTQQQATPVKREDQLHSSMSKLKGKLNWPIRGYLLAKFGSQRSSQVKWKGITISVNEGEKVRAVASGRVLFSGFFKGYGMVIALDHGDDYITLYGYNQTVLYKTGDVVFAGDAIALAGHSGGQDKNSLYFEISHKGKAENPLKWLKKR